MAYLIERAIGLGGGRKIPVHPFMACMAEAARAKITLQQLLDAFAITPDEVPELVAIYNAIVNGNAALGTGTTAADKLARADVVRGVLTTAEQDSLPGPNPYSSAESVRLRFGL